MNSPMAFITLSGTVTGYNSFSDEDTIVIISQKYCLTRQKSANPRVAHVSTTATIAGYKWGDAVFLL